jgi:hypothetical protein
MADVDLALGYAEITTINVQVDLVLGYVEATGNQEAEPVYIIENWDELAAPAITNWSTAHVTGTTGAWTTSTTQKRSSPNSAKFNSSTATATHQERIWHTNAYDFTAGVPPQTQLSFWVYHDTGNSSKNDTVQACISTNGGSSWTLVGSAISRYAASAGWVQYTADLSSYSAQAAVLIGFLGTSQAGGDIYVDDITLIDWPLHDQVDFVLGYVETLGSCAEVDFVLGYVETLYGSTPAPLYGPRWQ